MFGHVVSTQRIKPNQSKAQGIINALAPRDRSISLGFLGSLLSEALHYHARGDDCTLTMLTKEIEAFQQNIQAYPRPCGWTFSLCKKTETHAAYGIQGPAVKTHAIEASVVGVCRSEKIGWHAALLWSENRSLHEIGRMEVIYEVL
jgi:hypothetical protein